MPAEWKFKEVENLKKIITTHPIVGIVGIGGIPASQMQEMRKIIKDKFFLRVSKKSLIGLALEDGTKGLKNYMEGEVAIIASKQNPFKVFREIQQMKMKTAARGGEIAPEDIIIKKGDTPFKPGPIVGELQKVGIPASIRGGKVVIDKTITIVKKGEKISKEVANALARLDIKPIEIGLDVFAIFEDGVIYTPDVLNVDIDKILSDMQIAASKAMMLSIEIGYPTKDTIEAIIQKAYRNAYILALELNIYTKQTIEEFIRKAYLQAKELKNKIGG